ncbi:MAG: multicopper oxidase domain-containing protein [Deltaproteobacteria bacterium]|nr:multicopper oxidase domain-containing protein [Deltaproteobacteria bacterium]
MERREFLKWTIGGVSTLYVGTRFPWLRGTEAHAAGATNILDVFVTDAMKEMVTHNEINDARCYFWGYHMHLNGVNVPYECPAPTIVVTKGDKITFTVTNTLDEPHAIYIPGPRAGDPPQFDTGPIPPFDQVTMEFTATEAGAFLYYDNLNEPVNRVMGLHGALVVLPDAPSGAKYTPYEASLVTPGVQALYDDFGSSSHFPGLAWEQGDPETGTPPFRQYCWLTHQASPKLFAEVGSYTQGLDYPAQEFLDKFLRSPFSKNGDNYNPEFFTINGQSGMFAHFGPFNTPMGRVGEPAVVHILNAGLWTHSMHLHANHFYVTAMNGVVAENPIWIDVYNVKPMDRIDYTIPFMRPPDLPNERGCGYPDTPRATKNGHPVWPPVEELDVYMPKLGTTAKKQDGITDCELGQRQSPLCYPMHDHSEPSQTAQGGNYNCGLISGIYFLGDRNTAGHMDFPMDEDFAMMYRGIRGCSGSYDPAGQLKPPEVAKPACGDEPK